MVERVKVKISSLSGIHMHSQYFEFAFNNWFFEEVNGYIQIPEKPKGSSPVFPKIRSDLSKRFGMQALWIKNSSISKGPDKSASLTSVLKNAVIIALFIYPYDRIQWSKHCFLHLKLPELESKISFD